LYDEAKIEPTLSSKKMGQTLYVNMSKISPTTLVELVKAVDNASTTKDLNTMIIDFRGNVGGSLDFLVNFFGLFVGKNQYVFDFFHQGEYLPQRSVQPKYLALDNFKEIAILTDNMTQSTAELTTATFKKFNMAKVVGITTRGWGTVENTYPMETEIENGVKYSLLLVNNITLRDDGEPIEGRGVDPNVDISKPNWQSELNKHFVSKSLIEAIKKEIMVK
jgi:C-terminal processing protease CtpA/Prc